MKIYFTSGKVEEIEMNAREFNGMISTMKGCGIRFVQLRNGNFIPVNSNTMEIIESQLDDMKRKQQVVEEVVDEVAVQPEQKPKEESKDVGSEARAKEALEELISKSACKHEEKNQLLCKSIGKKGTRYFKVCQFCGYRSKFMSADLLTEGEKENAKAFTEE